MKAVPLYNIIDITAIELCTYIKLIFGTRLRKKDIKISYLLFNILTIETSIRRRSWNGVVFTQ